MIRLMICSAILIGAPGCASGDFGKPPPLANSGPPRPAKLYVISTCAPIEVIAGTTKVSPAGWFEGVIEDPGFNFFFDGRNVGNVKHCNFIEVSTTTGTHNVRVPLSGKSDYGIHSDAGLTIQVDSPEIYFATDEYKSLTQTNADIGRGHIRDINSVRKK